MICIKNGKGEHYAAGFEPCRYYWDNVINDDGTKYKGPWAPIPPCRDKSTVAPPSYSQEDLYKILMNIDMSAIVRCDIKPVGISSAGYIVTIRGEGIGFIKDKKQLNAINKVIGSLRKPG